MKTPTPKAEHLFRLHPHITCERSRLGKLQLNYGLGHLPVHQIGEYLDIMGREGWEIDEKSLAIPEENLYRAIRIKRIGMDVSTRLFRIIDGLRDERKSHARYDNGGEIKESIHLWIWSVFSESPMLQILEGADDPYDQIKAMQECLPSLCLELLTLFATTDTPLDFKTYRQLSLKVKTKVEEVLEGCSPKYIGLMKKALGSSIRSGKRSLVRSFQKRTHDIDWAKKRLTRKPKSLQ